MGNEPFILFFCGHFKQRERMKESRMRSHKEVQHSSGKVDREDMSGGRI